MCLSEIAIEGCEVRRSTLALVLKETATMQTAQTTTLRTSVLKTKMANPALQRLQGRLRAEAQVSEVITSYDRMHHRHNRS